MPILRRFLPLVFFAVLFAAAAQAQQTCGNSTCEQGENANNCPSDCVPVAICGDLVCDPGVGEDALTCPSDCASAAPFCGNNTCEAGEDISSCPADCGSQGPVCGNSSCEAGEDAGLCPADCAGGPGYVCGDNVCTPNIESCGNCIQDCPCWMPGTTCNANPYPGICENVCGNGVCGPDENAGNCAEDCSVTCGDSICSAGESCPADCAGCGDGFCDAGLGENDLSCAQDCSTGSVCTPDGICDAGAGENQQNCSADCAGGPICDSDGVCEGGENAASCPTDCSTPGAVCGDNVCTPNVESCGNCLPDCPCASGTTCSPNPAPGLCVQECGNGTCDPTETSATCPSDCSGPGFVCGDNVCTPNVESCGNCLQDCPCASGTTCNPNPAPGVCVQQCGNGTCDPTETNATCPSDCSGPGFVCGDNVCTPNLESCGNCLQDCPCAVGTTCSPNPVPGVCVQQCGDGTCDPTETNASCPQDCSGSGSCDNDGVCDPLENADTCASDCAAPACDFTDLPPNLQICCGDGVCDSGENPNRCARDCPTTCGDSVCSPIQGENTDTCAADCCLTGTPCANGCPVAPFFQMSHASVGALELVTFTADPTNIVGSVVNWDFGDGEHCAPCGLTTTHRYSRPGSFTVRLTATEPVCGGSQVSSGQTIVVGRPPLRDDAQILDLRVPACVTPQQGIAAQIKLRNVGGTTWSRTFGQKMSMVAGTDIFSASEILLPEGAVVPPGVDVTLDFVFGTPQTVLGSYTAAFQMTNLLGSAFGETRFHLVKVANICESSQPKAGDYTCAVTIRTPDGQPIEGIETRLTSRRFGDIGEPESEVVDRAVTDARGVAYLGLNRNPELPIQVLRCSAPNFAANEPNSKAVSNPSEVPTETHITLDLTSQTTSNEQQRIVASGLKSGNAVARLLQTGPYDKVIVIPAPFTGDEQTDKGPWTHDRLLDRFQDFVDAGRRKGYDFWLISTITGQNVNEQAAETAQIIDAAAKRLGPDGTVNVLGYSLGGVAARLATARYQADADWRVRLGVRAEPSGAHDRLWRRSPPRRQCSSRAPGRIVDGSRYRSPQEGFCGGESEFMWRATAGARLLPDGFGKSREFLGCR